MAEEDALPRWITVGEFVNFLSALYTNWDKLYCDELLDKFGLEKHRLLADLSKGGRARAGLLAALVHRPELLILDEPRYGLDPLARGEILEAVVRTASDEGRTVMFASHLLDEVARVCDTVGPIHQWQLLEVVATVDLSARYSVATWEADTDARQMPIFPGVFGWQQRGREWSAAVDRSKDPNDLAHALTIPSKRLRDVRPISLERWFAARVAHDPNSKRASLRLNQSSH